MDALPLLLHTSVLTIYYTQVPTITFILDILYNQPTACYMLIVAVEVRMLTLDQFFEIEFLTYS